MISLAPFHLRIVFSVLVALLSSNAHAATNSTNEISLAEVRSIVCDPHLSPEVRAAIKKAHTVLKDMSCPETTADGAAKPARTSAPAKTAPARAAANPESKTASPPAGGQSVLPPNTSILVRNSWTDAGILGASCLQPSSSSDGTSAVVDKSGAKGATASFTRDYAGNNKSWLAQGMIAAVYSSCDTNYIPRDNNATGNILEKSFGIYGQINSDYNSNAAVAKKNNIDTRTAGFSGEVAYEYGADIHVFRLIPNVVFDNIKNTTAVAVKAQYLPMWYGLWSVTGIPGFPYTISFNPALDLQYTSAMEHSQPLQFSGKDQSLRLGPEFGLIVAPIYSETNFFSHFGINETFYPWYEAYTGRGSYYWANSIFYDFTKDGSIALAFSNDRGLDENSGTMMNQYVLSLTGKI